MFEERDTPFRHLIYKPWSNEGIEHLFTGKDLKLPKSRFAETRVDLMKRLKLNNLIALTQVHGADVKDLRLSESFDDKDFFLTEKGTIAACGDALIIPRNPLWKKQRVAFAAMTADCVPILGRTQGSYFLIHAGWRGLAGGIIAQTISALGDEGKIECLIGPCAGSDLYEVGDEVISSFIDKPVYSSKRDKFLLNLAATAEEQIKSASPTAMVCNSRICTMSSSDFYSFRREGKDTGSNLTIVIV